MTLTDLYEAKMIVTDSNYDDARHNMAVLFLTEKLIKYNGHLHGYVTEENSYSGNTIRDFVMKRLRDLLVSRAGTFSSLNTLKSLKAGNKMPRALMDPRINQIVQRLPVNIKQERKQLYVTLMKELQEKLRDMLIEDRQKEFISLTHTITNFWKEIVTPIITDVLKPFADGQPTFAAQEAEAAYAETLAPEIYALCMEIQGAYRQEQATKAKKREEDDYAKQNVLTNAPALIGDIAARAANKAVSQAAAIAANAAAATTAARVAQQTVNSILNQNAVNNSSPPGPLTGPVTQSGTSLEVQNLSTNQKNRKRRPPTTESDVIESDTVTTNMDLMDSHFQSINEHSNYTNSVALNGQTHKRTKLNSNYNNTAAAPQNTIIELVDDITDIDEAENDDDVQITLPFRSTTNDSLRNRGRGNAMQSGSGARAAGRQPAMTGPRQHFQNMIAKPVDQARLSHPQGQGQAYTGNGQSQREAAAGQDRRATSLNNHGKNHGTMSVSLNHKRAPAQTVPQHYPPGPGPANYGPGVQPQRMSQQRVGRGKSRPNGRQPNSRRPQSQTGPRKNSSHHGQEQLSQRRNSTTGPGLANGRPRRHLVEKDENLIFEDKRPSQTVTQFLNTTHWAKQNEAESDELQGQSQKSEEPQPQQRRLSTPSTVTQSLNQIQTESDSQTMTTSRNSRPKQSRPVTTNTKPSAKSAGKRTRSPSSSKSATTHQTQPGRTTATTLSLSETHQRESDEDNKVTVSLNHSTKESQRPTPRPAGSGKQTQRKNVKKSKNDHNYPQSLNRVAEEQLQPRHGPALGNGTAHAENAEPATKFNVESESESDMMVIESNQMDSDTTTSDSTNRTNARN